MPTPAPAAFSVHLLVLLQSYAQVTSISAKYILCRSRTCGFQHIALFTMSFVEFCVCLLYRLSEFFLSPGEFIMTRIFLIITSCLLVNLTAIAGELPTTKRELAETRLLAEWVGDAEKQFVLGKVYYEGAGVPQDYNEAVKWFRLAADQGSVESQHMLGVMYDRGDGMPQDYSKATEWYREAADQGFAPAQYDLGSQYATGDGVPQNFSEAYVWFSLAASSGNEMAREDRDAMAGKLSKDKIAQAQQRAAQLFEKIQQGKSGQ